MSGAKREIDRIVSGYESEYIYLGKDMDNLKSIKSQYEAVYYALSNPVISLDSIAGLEAKAIACSLSALSLSFNSC